MEVRNLVLNPAKRTTYSNIITKGIKSNVVITPEIIINKQEVSRKKNGTVVYDMSLNKDFWKNIKEPINVVIDEAHSIINSRRSMSKVNVIMSDWMSLIRRVLGADSTGYGELVLITQLYNRIDIIAREMATQIRFHRCHYLKECLNCGKKWKEHNDMPEPQWNCTRCKSHNIKKFNHIIEVFHFRNMDFFLDWEQDGRPTYHRHYYVRDIEKYFGNYDTLQWDNMFSTLYE